ncbi:MAG: glycosyltransferase [Deltaproteobacteria bacterium]|nr:MAG: glycosyltransferase [Deltaproteobacteria bacterium]
MNAVKPTLSLCMIMKNEERWIAQCLKSVQGLVDEIVIVDTGSTDRSIEIAKSFGAKVYEHAWEDDFSKSRNRSLDYATGEWILVLDADEVIAESEKESLKQLIKNPPAPIIYLIQTNYLEKPENYGWEANLLTIPEAQGYPGFVESKLARLFMRRSVAFQGVVHEQAEAIDPKSQRFYSKYRIHHYGKYSSEDILQKKGNLYLQLGLKKLKDQPDNIQAYYEMGAQYLEVHRIDDAYQILLEGEKKAPHNSSIQILLINIEMKRKNLSSAIQRFFKILETEPENINAYIYLPSLFIESNQFDFAERVLKIGEPIAKQFPPYHLNWGALKMKQGSYRKAIRSYLKAIAIHPHYYLAHLNVAFCYGEIGEWEHSEKHYRISLQSPETTISSLQGLSQNCFRQKRYLEALSWIEKAIETITTEGLEKNLLYLSKATILTAQRDYKSAKEALQQISNFNDFNNDHLNSLDECLKKISITHKQGVIHGNQHQYY